MYKLFLKKYLKNNLNKVLLILRNWFSLCMCQMNGIFNKCDINNWTFKKLGLSQTIICGLRDFKNTYSLKINKLCPNFLIIFQILSGLYPLYLGIIVQEKQSIPCLEKLLVSFSRLLYKQTTSLTKLYWLSYLHKSNRYDWTPPVPVVPIMCRIFKLK